MSDPPQVGPVVEGALSATRKHSPAKYVRYFCPVSPNHLSANILGCFCHVSLIHHIDPATSEQTPLPSNTRDRRHTTGRLAREARQRLCGGCPLDHLGLDQYRDDLPRAERELAVA